MFQRGHTVESCTKLISYQKGRVEILLTHHRLFRFKWARVHVGLAGQKRRHVLFSGECRFLLYFTDRRDSVCRRPANIAHHNRRVSHGVAVMAAETDWLTWCYLSAQRIIDEISDNQVRLYVRAVGDQFNVIYDNAFSTHSSYGLGVPTKKGQFVPWLASSFPWHNMCIISCTYTFLSVWYEQEASRYLGSS